MPPAIADYFNSKAPSATRIAHTEFLKRTDGVKAINVSTGNVSLPAHPAMVRRLKKMTDNKSPFAKGVLRYSETQGLSETRLSFLKIFEANGIDTSDMNIIVTEGATFAMEVVILGISGNVGERDKKVLLIDPSYTTYEELARRTRRRVDASLRTLQENGDFTLPDLDDLEQKIKTREINALLIIPYDNPTGQFINQEAINAMARLCVKYNIWLVSDETYRNLYYTNDRLSSVWNIKEEDVKGIKGRRISIESASKVWNACGIRIGAIVTDNESFYDKALAESTGNLCPSVLGQYLFGALSKESSESLNEWYKYLRSYYKKIISDFVEAFRKENQDTIISNPQASIYSVVDVRNIAPRQFDSGDFVLYCAKRGKVLLENVPYTLLTCPMKGFYVSKELKDNPWKTQVRIAYVETAENMVKVPCLFKQLLKDYLKDLKS